MSNVSFRGFEELSKTLDNLGVVGSKIGNNALKSAAKIILREQKNEAPKSDKNSSDSASKLKASKIRRYKNGNSYISVGITGDNWEEVKGLWFQNFNGIHSSGKHIGWIYTAFEKSKDEAMKTMYDVVSSEVDKILK